MKVALVTGGSRGIGLGIARHLAASGFRIAVCGRKSSEHARDAMDAIQRAGGERVWYRQADVADRAARQDLVSSLADDLGRLDVLVNNAGMAPRQRADILEATEESFDEVIGANLRGPYFLTQACAHLMLRRREDEGQRCIINISSMSASVASVNRGEYCISKAGLSMATKLWAARLGEFGIPVYEVRPGIIKTDMTAGVEARYSALLEGGLTVQKRWGTPDDVGRAVAALARGEIPYATGQVLYVDGGLTLQRL